MKLTLRPQYVIEKYVIPVSPSSNTSIVLSTILPSLPVADLTKFCIL